MLLNLSPTDARTLAATAALDHVRRADGLYADEREAFQELKVRMPREIPFDIIAQALLMLFPLLLGAALAAANAERLLSGDPLTSAVGLSMGAWAFLVVPIARLAHLWSIWQRREADAAGLPEPEPFPRAELAHPLRRFAAFMIDLPLMLIASVVILELIVMLPASEDVETLLWWFAGIPLGMALATAPFMLREGRRSGQTLGKQALGIRVVTDRRGALSPAQTLVRELLIKAPIWGGPAGSLFFLPGLVNGVWSIVDPERRGLQDRAAGTRVVRA
jgi:uncharacterized RDD family membrane protein YckC